MPKVSRPGSHLLPAFTRRADYIRWELLETFRDGCCASTFDQFLVGDFPAARTPVAHIGRFAWSALSRHQFLSEGFNDRVRFVASVFTRSPQVTHPVFPICCRISSFVTPYAAAKVLMRL